MPIIQRPAAPPKIVAIESQLEEPLLTTLKAYCEFIDSTPDHVIATALLICVLLSWVIRWAVRRGWMRR